MPAPAPDLRALGVEVARLRKESGFSIDGLAEAAGVHRKTIIEVEAGRVAAKISTLHGIAHALGRCMKSESCVLAVTLAVTLTHKKTMYEVEILCACGDFSGHFDPQKDNDLVRTSF